MDVDSLEVGDVFNYSVVVNGNYDSLTYPAADTFDGDLEVLSRERFQVTNQRDSLVYRMQFFGVEDLVIPQKEITLHFSEAPDTSLFTNQVPIFFKTTLSAEDQEFRPFKPIFDFARDLWPFLLAAVLACIIGYLIYRWYRSRDSEPEPQPVELPAPFVNPVTELEHTISNLPGVETLQTREDYETFYIRLGDAIRYYLKRVYEIPALEMTTREIRLGLQKEMASSKIISITRQVLNEADIVKFANFQPGKEQAQQVLQTALHFIETAKIQDSQQIKYLKYQYDLKHGLIKKHEMAEQKVTGEK